MQRRVVIGGLATLALACGPVLASPRHYVLQPQDSTVGFTWFLGKDAVQGRMGVARADLALDFDDVRQSTVAVTVDASRAEAGFPFATQAMKGPKVLDTAEYPRIDFVSTRVARQGRGAWIDGRITVRGVTRPMAFYAELRRQQGTDPGNLSRLTVQLTGSLNRSEFGATGWSDMVGDEVRLNVVAQIARAG